MRSWQWSHSCADESSHIVYAESQHAFLRSTMPLRRWSFFCCLCLETSCCLPAFKWFSPRICQKGRQVPRTSHIAWTVSASQIGSMACASTFKKLAASSSLCSHDLAIPNGRTLCRSPSSWRPSTHLRQTLRTCKLCLAFVNVPCHMGMPYINVFLYRYIYILYNHIYTHV